MKTLYLESIGGVAGDMFAAAFVDAGIIDAESLTEIPEQLGWNVSIQFSHVKRATMKATHIDVIANSDSWKESLADGTTSSGYEKSTGHSHDTSHSHWHTHYSSLRSFLTRSNLPADEKELAQKIFRNLAEAEAAAHGTDLENVSFHEVGAVDSIIDVVMAARCIITSGAERFLASPIRVGRGWIHIEHGNHQVPPPASARLLQGMQIAGMPEGVNDEMELSTPTGLAILKTLGVQFTKGWPEGRVCQIGMGAGSRDPKDFANVFRVVLMDGQVQAEAYEKDFVYEVSCNLDDETPEKVAWLLEELMNRSALDCWIVPLTGKKNRPAMSLEFLCHPDDLTALCDFLLRSSSAFGLRYIQRDRMMLKRHEIVKDHDGIPVRYKVGTTKDGEFIKEKPEYEDLKQTWRQKNQPKADEHPWQ